MSHKLINLTKQIEQTGFVITSKEGRIVFTLFPSDNEISVTIEQNSAVFLVTPEIRDALKQDFPTTMIDDCRVKWNLRQMESLLQWLRSKKQFFDSSPTSDLEKMREDLLKVKENEKNT